MATVDAEGVNVATVEETVQGAFPPPNAGWVNLECDVIGDPGPDYKKMGRTPFTVSRQKRRPFVAGMDVTLTLEMDVTKDAMDTFGEAMFKAKWKHAGGKGQSMYHPTAVTATGFTVPANGDYGPHMLFEARGFGTANDGLKLSVVSADPAEIKVGGSVPQLAGATPPNAQLEFAGIQASIAGDLRLDAQGNLTSQGGVDFTTLGLQVGQLVYFPSQAEATLMGDVNFAFDNANYYGFAEIDVIAAGKLTFRRRDWAVGALDAAAGQTVRVLFTKWIRNVPRSHVDEKLVSHCFEILYPKLAAGPADAYEYLRGYMLDMVTFNLSPENKVTMSLTFVGRTDNDPSAVRQPGPSTALDPVTGLAISTAQDMARLMVANLDESGLMTDFEDLKVMLKNNVGAEKALGTLGNRFTPLGTFEAATTSKVFFTTPEMVIAVRDNRILRLAAGGRNTDFGMVIDIPSTGAMKSKKDITHNKLVKIDSETDGFMDATRKYTASLSMFAYLPKA
jgi:hypothetical protein